MANFFFRLAVKFGVIACVLALICTFTGIPSLVIPNWEEYHISPAVTVATDFFTNSHSRGIFQNCIWNKNECKLLQLDTPSDLSPQEDRIINLRRAHAALMISAICLAFIAAVIFLVYIIYAAVRSGFFIDGFRVRLMRRICLSCAIICFLGALCYTAAFICFHVRIAEETYVPDLTQTFRILDDTYGKMLSRTYTENKLYIPVRQYSAMYGLGLASYAVLVLATIFFLLPLCLTFHKRREKSFHRHRNSSRVVYKTEFNRKLEYVDPRTRRESYYTGEDMVRGRSFASEVPRRASTIQNAVPEGRLSVLVDNSYMNNVQGMDPNRLMPTIY